MDFDKIVKNWNKYTYPWKPSKDFIDFIKKYYNIGDKILILGATKEFRELFKDIEITICDLSINMINKCDVGNLKEKVIIDSWFTLKKGNYDLIIGDLIFYLFNKNEQKKLEGILLNNLSKRGKMIIRHGNKKKIKKNKKIFGIKRILGLYNKFNSKLQYFNYISFELVIGLGFNSNNIFNLLLCYNKKIAIEFKKCFSKLVPYNNIKICINSVDFLKKEDFLLKDLIFVEEKIILFKNNKGKVI